MSVLAKGAHVLGIVAAVLMAVILALRFFGGWSFDQAAPLYALPADLFLLSWACRLAVLQQ